MKSKKITVISEIAQLMIDLQVLHSLPVNIIVGNSHKDDEGDEQQDLICEYEDEDYHAYAWIVDKATITFVNALAERISAIKLLNTTLQDILENLNIIGNRNEED